VEDLNAPHASGPLQPGFCSVAPFRSASGSSPDPRLRLGFTTLSAYGQVRARRPTDGFPVHGTRRRQEAMDVRTAGRRGGLDRAARLPPERRCVHACDSPCTLAAARSGNARRSRRSAPFLVSMMKPLPPSPTWITVPRIASSSFQLAHLTRLHGEPRRMIVMGAPRPVPIGGHRAGAAAGLPIARAELSGVLLLPELLLVVMHGRQHTCSPANVARQFGSQCARRKLLGNQKSVEVVLKRHHKPKSPARLLGARGESRCRSRPRVFFTRRLRSARRQTAGRF